MTSIFSFPFEQIGSILRTLSLSGGRKNLFAIVLYILFCSSPIFYLAHRRLKKRYAAEDFILIFISLCLFCSMYLYINPGYISKVTGLSFLTEQQLYNALGSTLWSIIICYILFRILYGIERKETPDLLLLIRYIVTTITILTVLDIFGNGQKMSSSYYSRNTCLPYTIRLPFLCIPFCLYLLFYCYRRNSQKAET